MWHKLRRLVTGQMTMLDSVDVSVLLRGYPAYAGYVGGWWVTFPLLKQLFPKANLLSIAVNASEVAECLDVESGDATIAQAPAWFRMVTAAGVKYPVFYTSASNVNLLITFLSFNGIARDEYRIWSAHYAGQHICGPSTCAYTVSGIVVAQCDGTQWTDRYKGLNIDASLLRRGFFAVPNPPAPPSRGIDHMTGQVTGTKMDIVLPPGVQFVRFGCSMAAEISVDTTQGTTALALDYSHTPSVAVPKGARMFVVHVVKPAADGTPVSFAY